MWSNGPTKKKFQAVKSHSLVFAVRIEDKLHANIVQSTDACSFTVRPVNYTLGMNDTDITVGTNSTLGNGVRVDGVQTGSGEDRIFRFDVQAAMLNLDPEFDYWYDITYIRSNYSISVASGEFEILANPSNKGGSVTYVGTGTMFQLVAGVDGQNLLTVTASMPLPQQGPVGNGSYMVNATLSPVIGGTITHPLGNVLPPAGRPVQLGDVVFSAFTTGVLADVSAITTSTATLRTRQVYAREPLKFLLDTQKHVFFGTGYNGELVDAVWSIDKASVPLPPEYSYLVGDTIWSTSALSVSSSPSKVILSQIEGVYSLTLSVRTKVVLPWLG